MKEMLSRSAIKSQQQQHRRSQTLRSPTASARDEDLVLFTEMQRRERECRAAIPEGTRLQTPRCHRTLNESFHSIPASSTPIKNYGAIELFSSDLGKSDYDWLMTPPSTPFFLPVDGNSTSSGVSHIGAASVRSALKTSKLGSSRSDISSRAEHHSNAVHGNLGIQQPLNVNSICSLSSVPAQSAVCGVPRTSSHSFKPAVRHSVPSPTQMLSHTPVGEVSSSSPASMGTRPTMMQNGSSHIATPLVRAGVPHGRSACSSRTSTPVKRSPSPSHPCNPPTSLFRCASANRASSSVSRGASFSRPCSPTGKAWLPEAHRSLSQERPPNLRTSLPERSVLNSRSSTSKASQTEQSDLTCRSRRQASFSVVTRGAAFTASQNGKNNEYISGALDGRAADMSDGLPHKLAVRVVHEKKKPMMCSEERLGDLHGKKPVRSTPMRDIKSIFSSTRDSSVGRNESKKSLDLTLRHMDICKETPRKWRSFMSSMSKPRGLGKGSCQNGLQSMGLVVASPMATGSTTSSEHNMSIVIDAEGSELGDESVSDKGSRSSVVSQHDLFLLGKEKRISNWLRSPDYRDDDEDIMQIFEQEGLESLSGPESPLLISELEGTLECDHLSLDPKST